MLMHTNADRQRLPWRVPARSRLRLSVVIGLVLAGAFHLPVTPEHLEEAPLWGLAFAGFAAAAVALGVLVARRDEPARYVVVFAFCVLAVTTYVVRRLVPLPGIEGDVGSWFEPWGVASATAETITAVLAAFAVAFWGLRQRP